MQKLPWLPPWQLDWASLDVSALIDNLPAMLVVSFVGLLTILLSVASLELNFHKEFSLNKVLKTHAAVAVLSACLGGFVGILSIGRTMLNRQTGGGAISGVIAAIICLAALLGAGHLVAYLPKAALGGLVLFLGFGMLKQWLWDQWRTSSRAEFAQIVTILVLVANFGFMVGFFAGLLISCVVFVVTYSRIPLADLATDLSLFASSVVRPDGEVETLEQHGGKTRIYRLSGYVFFGSATKIEAVFNGLGGNIEGIVIDFTSVSGIDSSAISVFQRILRRYRAASTHFYFAYGSDERSVRAIASARADDERIHLFPSLDHAVETAEDSLLKTWSRADTTESFGFLEDTAGRDTFLGYCEMRHIRAGEPLCAENQRSDEVFFIETGGFEVLKARKDATAIRLAKLHRGAIVGELAFYTGEARTASIIAVSDSSVYVLHKSALTLLRSEHPDLATRFDHMVIRKLSHALTRTNQLITTFR